MSRSRESVRGLLQVLHQMEMKMRKVQGSCILR